MGWLDLLAGTERLSEKQEARLVFLLDAAINIACIIGLALGFIWLAEAFVSSVSYWSAR